MTVAEVIEKLKEYPLNAEFGIDDPDTGWWAPKVIFDYDAPRNEVSATAEYVDMISDH